MMKQGAQGQNVKELQHKLSKLGFQVSPDGVFGPKTEDAVRQLQKSAGADVDGVVGPVTTQAIEQRIRQGWTVQQSQGAGIGQDRMPPTKKQ
jgi:peptidoglycan hydrolase-like protein with peptidoglycan-binding domain